MAPCSDPDNGPNKQLNSVVGDNPADGTMTLNADGSFPYTPNAGFIGKDSFVFQASMARGTPKSHGDDRGLWHAHGGGREL